MPADLALKYVILHSPGITASVPVIFAALLSHCEVVANLLATGATVVSAGYLRVDSDGQSISVQCWGRSDTLDMESRPEKDASLIRSHFEMAR